MNKGAKFATAFLLALLVAIVLPTFIDQNTTKAEATDYGDIMQYDWPQTGHDDGHTRFNPGPAPDTPNLLWTSAYGSIQTVFDGKAFSASGGKLWAVDALTGTLIWSTNLTYGGYYIDRIDDNYLVMGSFGTMMGLAVYRIADGAYVSRIDYVGGSVVYSHPGGGQYFIGRISRETKMKYEVIYNTITEEASIIAVDLSDPPNPRIAWNYICHEPSSLLACGDGKVFVGSYQGAVYALDGRNGTLLWRSPKIGMANTFSATYYNGKLYHGTSTTRLTCYDGDTGEILWDYDAGSGRSFFAYGGAAGYGRVYFHNIDPEGSFVGCWDAETGELLWKHPAYYYAGYQEPALADGKLYIRIGDRSPALTVAGQPSPGYIFAAIDAFTGTTLWTIPRSLTLPVVAYGNLYASTYCFGRSLKPWPMWQGSPDNIRVFVGQTAPEKLKVKWTYKTGEPVTSSPVIVDGKLYIGSNDQNLYCLDAHTGNKIWNFTTGFRVASTPAVADGKVYIGPDDGYIYCLDAKTGTQIWKKDAGGFYPNILVEVATWQPRSSPIIVGDRLYVGALDGKVYCLNKADGSTVWTYQTQKAIVGSPAYSDGRVYIASLDKNVYALDATTGTKIWNWTTTRAPPTSGSQFYAVQGAQQNFMIGTPTVAEGKVFIGCGPRISSPQGTIHVALNATTGGVVWNASVVVGDVKSAADNQDNTNTPFAATYFKGVLYRPAYMGVAAFNATNGKLLWHQWIGHQVFSTVAYADDIRSPKLYVGSDSYSITCLNATSGKPLSTYTTRAQVVSSPTIYDSKLYVGSCDSSVYCFVDWPVVCTGIWAASNKGEQIWSNETITISGKLHATVNYTNPYYEPTPTGDFSPGLPNATVILSINKPDLSSVNVTTKTDNMGHFTVSYSPTQAGTWGWVAYYEGQQLPHVTYNAAYTEWNQFEVTAPPSSVSPTPTPTPTPAGGTPVEYIYAAVAIIAIVLIAIGAYAYTRRTKK